MPFKLSKPLKLSQPAGFTSGPHDRVIRAAFWAMIVLAVAVAMLAAGGMLFPHQVGWV